MRLLFLSLTFPFPPTNGHKLRTWAVLRALAAEGHDLTVLTFDETGELKTECSPLLEITKELEIEPLKPQALFGRGEYIGRLQTLLGRCPHGVKRFSSPGMAARIKSRLDSEKYDAIFAETSYAIVNLPPSFETPLILDNHNVEHRLLERFMETDRNPARRIYAALECRKMRAWERMAWAQANLTLACSDIDRRLIEQLSPPTPTAVVPNTIDVESYNPFGDGEPGTILYAGGMDWFPNRDAVSYFVGEILPRVRHLHFKIKFVVAGRSPSEEFRREFANNPEVEFTGTVADMRPEINRATICVVPLRVGSGTRLKILEAAAMGKPVVSTRVGAEGLDFEDGQEIILAGDSAQFANAVSRLLGDKTLRRRLGAAARHKVEQRYSFTCLRAALKDALAIWPAKPVRSPAQNMEVLIPEVSQ